LKQSQEDNLKEIHTNIHYSHLKTKDKTKILKQQQRNDSLPVTEIIGMTAISVDAIKARTFFKY
jgi:hypothetical protein